MTTPTPEQRLAEAIEADFEPEQIDDWQGDGSYAVLLKQRLEEKGLTLITRRDLDLLLAELQRGLGLPA